ncbi:MAG: WYL domain-containing transcriptional regulator [Clostridia bacterium]|nr:WYL domain-containing transcriptional regulator [Clostridia bacterium]
MPNANCQKIKLLKIMEMLRQDTDEENPITTSEMVRRLEAMGISSERRSVAKDIAELNRQGYEVLITRRGKEKAFYVEDRSFSVPEIKVLIDAVQAASFITEKKTAELIDKLSGLGGSHRAEILKSNLVCFNTRKHSNESIFYNIDCLEEALQKKCKVSFLYFDLDIRRRRVYRKSRERYSVEPIALVFSEDNYYLLTYNPKHESTVVYRVDRMEQVRLESEAVCKAANIRRRSVSSYTSEVFRMFGGEKQKVTLCFDPKLIGAVYDKFGEEIRLQKTGEWLCATATVQISPPFWGWVFQFGNKMRVTAPESAVEEFQRQRELIFERER